MANTPGSKIVDSPITLRQLIQQSYLGGDQKQWLEPIHRQERHVVRLDSVIKWKVSYAKGFPERDKVHTFRIRVYNYNMVSQTTTNYQSAIIMDSLSLDAPVKVRCGGYIKYKKDMKKEYLKKNGFCGDFYFVSMNALKRNNMLFGKDTTNGNFPVQMNPQGRVHLCKHLISAIKVLIKTKYFQHNKQQSPLEKVFIGNF